MKHLILALVILGLLLAFSAGSVIQVSDIANHTTTLLRQAQEQERAGRSQAARQTLSEAVHYWNSKETFLCIVLRHEQVDTVTETLAKLNAYANSEDQDDFYSTCAELLEELNHLSQMELPLPKNIL